MFNPSPNLGIVRITPDQVAVVIDDALLQPQPLVEIALTQRDDFQDSARNAYPGPELRMPDWFSERLNEFFVLHARARLGARRTLSCYSRLSMVTRRESELEPRQWICHRDRLDTDPANCVVASVLYLFRDAQLGGTAFFSPTRDAHATAVMVHESGALPGAQFATKYGVVPGYPRANAWFERTGLIAPKFNRLIFYLGGEVFHAGHIPHPEKLSPDPRHGRLTLNGFFVCRRAAR